MTDILRLIIEIHFFLQYEVCCKVLSIEYDNEGNCDYYSLYFFVVCAILSKDKEGRCL